VYSKPPRITKLIQSQWGIIKDYEPSPEVAVLVDLDNALLTFAMS
jgi:hypothetical protein